MYVVLTGAVPPFAQSMAHSGCRGMCADGLQDVVSTILRKGLDSSRALSHFPRAAQVRHLKPHNGPHHTCAVCVCADLTVVVRFKEASCIEHALYCNDQHFIVPAL